MGMYNVYVYVYHTSDDDAAAACHTAHTHTHYTYPDTQAATKAVPFLQKYLRYLSRIDHISDQHFQHLNAILSIVLQQVSLSLSLCLCVCVCV